MVAAGYALYSSSLQFVWATKETVSLFTYHFSKNEWICVNPNIEIPNKVKTYSINDGNQPRWGEKTLAFIQTEMRGRSSRWMTCMVSDVHRNLIDGGIFMYPVDKKNLEGRLRLVYEAYPMAFIFAQAGGMEDNILDMIFPIENIHQKAPVVIGSIYEMEIWKSY